MGRTPRWIAALSRNMVALLSTIAFGGLMYAVLFLGILSAGVEISNAGNFILHEDADPVVLPPILTPSKVYAADIEEPVWEFKAEINRRPIKLEEMPQSIVDAVLAAEDDNFFEHKGVDAKAIIRAFRSNFEAGTTVQGGSTITQQLVKNDFFIDDEEGVADQTLERKIQEAFMALRLERRLPKEQILERYLNTVYLGNGAYGVQSASQLYYGKPASELTIGEAALLAGIIASPQAWEPYTHPEKALERRSLVVDRLHTLQWITKAQRDELKDQELVDLPTEKYIQFEASTRDYFIQTVLMELLRGNILPGNSQEKYDQVFYGGLEIVTTLRSDLQELAEQAVKDHPPITSQCKRYTCEAALASVDARTGAVLALYGGENFQETKFNLATQGKRQSGSSFKPFGLIAALERGYSPYDIFDGSSGCHYKGDLSGKSVQSHGGPMTLWEGTYRSINCVFVNVVNQIGARAVLDTAYKLGIETKQGEYPSVVLGGLDPGVSPLEMAGAYATIAAEGVRHKTHLIQEVRTSTGEVIYQATPEVSERVLNENVARTAVWILKDVVEKGTAYRRGRIGRPAAGKTGTTNDRRDAWFIGFTPQIATAVWVGNPNSATMTGYFGGQLPTAIWNQYMTGAHEDLEIEEFHEPDLVNYRRERRIGSFRIRPTPTRSTLPPGAPRPLVPSSTTAGPG